jgi:hypothetical protein
MTPSNLRTGALSNSECNYSPQISTTETALVSNGRRDGDIPQSETAVSSSVGVPFSNGLEPALEVWSLNDVAGERRDRHDADSLDRTQLIGWGG